MWENLFHSMAFGTLKGEHVALHNPAKNTRVFLGSIQPVGRNRNDSKLSYSTV